MARLVEHPTLDLSSSLDLRLGAPCSVQKEKKSSSRYSALPSESRCTLPGMPLLPFLESATFHPGS